MKFICITECFWNNRHYYPGAEYEGETACKHFAPADGKLAAALPQDEETPRPQPMTLAQGQASVAGDASCPPGTLPQEPEPDYAGMTKPKLLAMAKRLGVHVHADDNKDQIIAAIKKAS